MIRISQLKLPITHTKAQLEKKIAKTLKNPGNSFTYEIRKQSLDCRHKNDKIFVYTVDVTIRDEQKLAKKVNNNNIMLIKEKPYEFPSPGETPLLHSPVIVGSGPAGLSAAINAKIRNKNIIVFGTESLSNKLIKAPSIDNYLGFYEISGEELREKFQDHLDKMEIEITYKKINNIYAMGDYFALMSGDDMYEATTVILATGVEYGKPIKGEEEFLGKGVGYCATCDAPLYKDKKVAIIGYNKESKEEANFLNEIASKTYFIPMYKNDSLMRESNELDNSIEVINDRPVQIKGENLVNKVSFKEKEIDVDGVFVIKDSASPKSLVPGIETEGPHIKVDINMQTSITGCFAAGDCAGKPYSYIKSAGQGQIAAINAVSYLDKLRIEQKNKK